MRAKVKAVLTPIRWKRLQFFTTMAARRRDLPPRRVSAKACHCAMTWFVSSTWRSTQPSPPRLRRGFRAPPRRGALGIGADQPDVDRRRRRGRRRRPAGRKRRGGSFASTLREEARAEGPPVAAPSWSGLVKIQPKATPRPASLAEGARAEAHRGRYGGDPVEAVECAKQRQAVEGEGRVGRGEEREAAQAVVPELSSARLSNRSESQPEPIPSRTRSNTPIIAEASRRRRLRRHAGEIGTERDEVGLDQAVGGKAADEEGREQ